MSSATLSEATHPLGALRRLALAEHQRADAVRIAERRAGRGRRSWRRPRSRRGSARCTRGDRREDVRRRRARARADALQLVREHVEQHFGVGAGVDVAPVVADQHFRELGGVGQVAVVREADAVRRVDVERLRLGGGVAAGGRIAQWPMPTLPFRRSMWRCWNTSRTRPSPCA